MVQKIILISYSNSNFSVIENFWGILTISKKLDNPPFIWGVKKWEKSKI
jgi:hypothetical protein